MDPCQFYKCLSDETRLKSLLIIAELGEACVCHLMTALAIEQPKISRHLAELRKHGVVIDDRRGKWVYYQLHPDLPQWAKTVIDDTRRNNRPYFEQALTQLRTL